MLKRMNASVTGSTSGTGLGVALTLAAQGANVVLNGFGNASEIERLNMVRQTVRDIERKCVCRCA